MSRKADTLPENPDNDNDDLAEVPEPPAASVDVSALAGAIVGAVNAAQGPRKVSNGEYMRTRSLHRDKPQLARKCFQNGIELMRSQLTADAIEMVNQIRPGIYADGMLKVLAVHHSDRDKFAAVKPVDIQYSNKSVDERMSLKSRFSTFEDMLRCILREMSAVRV